MIKKKATEETIKRLSIAKYVLLAVLILYIGLVVSQNRSSRQPFSKIAESIVKGTDLKTMQEGSTQQFKQFYGLNMADFEDVILYYPNESMGVDELLLVKVKSDEQMEGLMTAVENRVATQKKNFEGYGEEQIKLLSKAVIKKQGDLLFFVVSPKAEQIKEKFLKAL